MTLPSSGPISFSQLSRLCRGANTATAFSNWDVRYLLGDDSRRVALSDAYGKPRAGSAGYYAPGAYTFLIPPYVTLTVDVVGGSGGGGGGSDHFPYLYCLGGGSGSSGGTSVFYSPAPVVGPGGGGAPPGQCRGYAPGDLDVGASIGAGGDTNTTGYAGGGRGRGSGPGGVYSDGGAGGASGRAVKTWSHNVTANYPRWKSGVTVVVGGPGYGGGRGSTYCSDGGNGATGYVSISWA
jgi:hypothetical protein